MPFASDLFHVSSLTGFKCSCPIVTEQTTLTHTGRSHRVTRVSEIQVNLQTWTNRSTKSSHAVSICSTEYRQKARDCQRQHEELDIPALKADQRSVFDSAVHTCNLTQCSLCLRLDTWHLLLLHIVSAHRMTDYTPTAQTQRTNEYNQMKAQSLYAKASCLHYHTEHLK